ncbi:MAG: hypothetical protein KC736_03050 [Candidatus Moranbacteria bacterium]|nr:hypothetical protein [Candidatus Moranbacteria bacterium]
MISIRSVLVILFLIVCLGGFLRFYNLGERSFSADEFLDINATVGYAQTGQWQAWDHNLQVVAQRENALSDQRAWLYRIQVAKLFSFVPPTEFFARSVSVLWGLVTIVLMYFVGSSFSRSRTVGLLSAFFFAVSIVGIEFDRTLRMYAMFFPVFLLLSWLLFQLLENVDIPGRLRQIGFVSRLVDVCRRVCSINVVYLLPVLFVGLLSFHLHPLTANIAFVLLGYICVMLIVRWRQKKKMWPYSFFLSSAGVLLLVGALFFRSALAPLFAGLVFFENHYSYIGTVLSDYQHPLIGLLLVVFGAYFLLCRRETFTAGVWLSSCALVILLAAVFLWRRVAGEQYIFFVQSFVIILLSAGVYGLATLLRDVYSGRGRQVFVVIISLAILLVPAYGYFFNADDNAYHQTSRSSQPRYREIFSYVMKHRQDDAVLVTRNFRNYYWAGKDVSVVDFGGERTKRKITRDEIVLLTQQYSSGWVVLSDNDEEFVSKEALEFMEENFERVNDVAVRGPVLVYRWNQENNFSMSDEL